MLLASIYSGNAQVIYGEYPEDSFIVNFATTNPYVAYINGDTSANPLWQRGYTSKHFSPTDSITLKGMMTDTVGNYNRNANNYFILDIYSLSQNQIVTFWHSYTTDSTHAGGIVEYSLDLGNTWQNIIGYCNADGKPDSVTGTRTENFYPSANQLTSGDPAFTGTSYGHGYSRFQFYIGTYNDSICNYYIGSEIRVRFRFLSDNNTDTTAGWLIDSITVRHDYYNAGVKTVKNESLPVFPNPSEDGIFYFPDNRTWGNTLIHVYNSMGMNILNIPYSSQVNLSNYPPGLYVYKIIADGTIFSGQLIKE